MLKKIPTILYPLMPVLINMGHGDMICLGDSNFPAASTANGTPGGIVRLDGHGIPEILEALLDFFPLDIYVEEGDSPVVLMKVVEGDDSVPTDGPRIWQQYKNIIESSEEADNFKNFIMVERTTFYDLAEKCFAVVATGELELYANIMLVMGVVKPPSE